MLALTLLLLLALQLAPLEVSVLLFLALETPSAALLCPLEGLLVSDSDALCERLRVLLRLGGGLARREDDDTRSRRRTSALGLAIFPSPSGLLVWTAVKGGLAGQVQEYEKVEVKPIWFVNRGIFDRNEVNTVLD